MFSAKPAKVKAEPRPSARQSILNQNLNNKKDKADSPEKRPAPSKQVKDTKDDPKESKNDRVPYKPNQMAKKESTNIPSRSQMTDRGECKKDKADKAEK